MERFWGPKSIGFEGPRAVNGAAGYVSPFVPVRSYPLLRFVCRWGMGVDLLFVLWTTIETTEDYLDSYYYGSYGSVDYQAKVFLESSTLTTLSLQTPAKTLMSPSTALDVPPSKAVDLLCEDTYYLLLYLKRVIIDRPTLAKTGHSYLSLRNENRG